MFRLLASALIGFALVLPGLSAAQTASAPTDMTDTDRQKLRAEVRAYLLDNPDVILEALQFAAKGPGLLGGFAILFVAMVIDRIVQGAFRRADQKE